VTVRAFTGPSLLSPLQKYEVASRILQSPVKAERWISGCAYGVDSIVAYLAMAVDVELTLMVPFARHNGTLLRELAQNAHVVRCAKGRTTADSYRIRNRDMVLDADHLHAFVKQPSFYRSGEWMTINIAREMRIPVLIEVIGDI